MSPALVACLLPLILVGGSYGVGYFVGRRRLVIRSPIKWKRADDLIDDEYDDSDPEPLPVVNSRQIAIKR